MLVQCLLTAFSLAEQLGDHFRVHHRAAVHSASVNCSSVNTLSLSR
jgi:hypothetical protein